MVDWLVGLVGCWVLSQLLCFDWLVAWFLTGWSVDWLVLVGCLVTLVDCLVDCFVFILVLLFVVVFLLSLGLLLFSHTLVATDDMDTYLAR